MTPEHLVVFSSADRLPPVSNEPRRDSITCPFLPSRGMHSVLDAMASLCVREGKGDVYAVGLQISGSAAARMAR